MQDYDIHKAYRAGENDGPAHRGLVPSGYGHGFLGDGGEQMKPIIWIAAVFAALCFECDGQPCKTVSDSGWIDMEPVNYRPLIASQSFLAASQSADVGARQEAIKGAATVGVIIAEWLIVRRWPGTARGFTWANYLTGAATFGVAGRNWGLR